MVTDVGSTIREKEMLLNGIRFPLKAEPQRVLTSLYAPKIVIGDVSAASQQSGRSTVAFSDQRGGIGIDRGLDATLADRCWWSTCNLDFRNLLTLPRQTVATAVPASADPVTHIIEFANEVYACFGTAVHKYNNSTDSWGASLHTLPAACTDVVVYRQAADDTDYLVFAFGTGYTFTTDGSAFTDESGNANDDVKFIQPFDDELYGISAAGVLVHCEDIEGGGSPVWVTGEFTPGTKLPLESGSVTDLYLFRNATDAVTLFASTTSGMYAYDASNAKWIKQTFSWPRQTNAGRGTVVWNDDLYVPIGHGVYKRTGGSNPVVSRTGPDRDHGLPTLYRGTIKQLIETQNGLVALLDSQSRGGVELEIYGDRIMNAGGHRSGVTPEISTYPAVLKMSPGGAWSVLWVDDAVGGAMSNGTACSAYSDYRLWWAVDDQVYYQKLPRELVNPDHAPDDNYAEEGEHEYADFDADDITATKTALQVVIEARDMGGGNEIEVHYHLDHSGAETLLATISTDGKHVYNLPSEAVPEGLAFRSIRWHVRLVRGSGSALVNQTPKLVRLEFSFRRKLPPKWGWQVTVDASKLKETYNNKTAAQLMDEVDTLLALDTLASFTYRDKDKDPGETYYVDVLQASGYDFTGHDKRFERRLFLAQI